jgi:hypothetical protein
VIDPRNNNEPHPALAGLLRMLPRERDPMPPKDKEAFMAVFSAVFDYVYPPLSSESSGE